MTKKTKHGTCYEVRQIDAWRNEEDGWTWNESYLIGEFRTDAREHGIAFRRWLVEHDIVFKLGTTKTVYDGSIYEVQNRKTDEPLFAAIPKE